jgi:hypothetical protein
MSVIYRRSAIPLGGVFVEQRATGRPRPHRRQGPSTLLRGSRMHPLEAQALHLTLLGEERELSRRGFHFAVFPAGRAYSPAVDHSDM